MDGVLSQEEINALLNDTGYSAGGNEALTESEIDAIGEIANICMGTAATTLFSLVNRRVEISTPVVTMTTWDDIVEDYEKPCVFIRIAYTAGLDGSNLLVLKESDVKVITDLMMGGDGSNVEGELGELHLSAISEAMNQMMGSSATSLSSMLNKMVDISPPQANLIDLKESIDEVSIDKFLSEKFVKISFRMEIGDLVDSEIMQLYPIDFAKEMCAGMTANMDLTPEKEVPVQKNVMETGSNYDSAPSHGVAAGAVLPADGQVNQMNPMNQMNSMGQMNQFNVMNQMSQPLPGQPVNVQAAQFTPFNNMPVNVGYQPENINLIMDVPLEVTVELGRTSKSIAEILEFSPGKIIELNKIAGEPIDVLVNGKNVAKGEVVVIEESFGIRITEIVGQI